ncbi:hypothetical protein GUITHDRAFT_106910 [Guillardia theta CCMP2712]|uniref:Uncharacterized protein n=1 Tax=Guillardia theta (strain CCMP2712) TaxID=905079 RepID=L1JH96_GUITC|nr:hypothetical protein GUITHDRAFT_106910 [Guillardia theta CCMP2712]EKX47470.1 hypothetical protein GUITHDRAFT_106910 [Guillardia theta CCMP2712]|eukprot:XP_005834450.1 hypothetical protein GUITHDRAFT_106910 [Guillardia theta CCMP2712]
MQSSLPVPPPKLLLQSPIDDDDSLGFEYVHAKPLATRQQRYNRFIGDMLDDEVLVEACRRTEVTVGLTRSRSLCEDVMIQGM